MNPQEMRMTEALCTEEHAPACSAACPLHIDMRAITGHLREGEPYQGNAAKAAALYASRAIYPRLLAKLCDSPCEGACVRKRIDSPVAIGALERHLMRVAPPAAKPIRSTVKSKKTAAIVGAGLSGLAAAHHLAKKDFAVTVFERQGAIGAQFVGQSGVTQQDLDADLGPTLTLCTVETGTAVGGPQPWRTLLETYDAVLVTGALPAALRTWPIDSETLRIGETNAFAAGRGILGHASPVRSLSDGRRAAISMERLLTRVSLTAARVHETAYETGLSVETGACESIKRQAEGPEGFSDEQATAEANRCIDCHCLVCVRQCKFMQKFERFPRLYIREIANTVALVGSGNRSGKNLLVACSLCGLCQQLCPNAVPIAQVVLEGRRAMADKGELPPATFDFPVRDMLYAGSDGVGLCRHAPGETASDYLFFPGCQLSACDPQNILPAYQKLLAIHPKTGIFLGCCGAPADWAGRTALYEETVAALKAKIAEMGNPTLLTACPTCERALSETGTKTRSVWGLLAEQPTLQPAGFKGKVAVHDSCTARLDAPMQNAVRTLITASGYEIEELEFSRDKTKCCGYGGLVFYGDNEVAKAMIDERAAESPLPYVTYCSVCRDYLAKAGKPALHVLDLLLGKDDTAHRKPVSLSQKEYNRLYARDALLAYYGEPVTPRETLPLTASEDALERIDERLITLTNVYECIREAERSGKKLVNPGNGHFIASARPGIITYWVEYSAESDGTYTVHNAYSHRIRVEEDLA